MRLAGLDIETTGLEQDKGHRIIEVALLVYDMAPDFSHTFRGGYVQRVNPQRSISPGAQAVHGISFEELTDKPVWEEVAPKVVKILSAVDVVVAHNGIGFDLPFIAAELVRVGIRPPNVKVIDTIEARWATPLGKYPTLGELCFAFNLPYDKAKAHAARYDVERMMDCLFKGLKQGFFQLPQEEAAHEENLVPAVLAA